MVQTAAKVMIEKKVNNGSIINISSIEAKVCHKYLYYGSFFQDQCQKLLVVELRWGVGARV